MPDTPNTIETKPLQDTPQSAAQPAPPIETQETPPADTTPNWFETHKPQLVAGGISAIVTVLFFIAILLSLRHIISRGASKLSTGLGKFIHRLSIHISLLFLLTGLSYSNSLIEFPKQIDHIINRLFFALFIVVFLAGILTIINAIDNTWTQHFQRKNKESYATSKLMLDLIRRIVKTVVWFIAILFILQNLFHVEITPLLTGAGVVGVAIAFAAQNTIANLFGAFSILGSQLFKVGDWVKIGDAEGTVEQIGLRSIRLRAFEGRLIDIPNRVIADTQLDNFSNRDFYRECFTFGLVYQTTPKQMEKAHGSRQAAPLRLRRMLRILPENPRLHLVQNDELLHPSGLQEPHQHGCPETFQRRGPLLRLSDLHRLPCEMIPQTLSLLSFSSLLSLIHRFSRKSMSCKGAFFQYGIKLS